MKVPVDSGFELFVVEGGGQGSTAALRFPHVTLGREDPTDVLDESVITFPDSTVSRVHAVLLWDEKKKRYCIEHRSHTNATVVNGHAISSTQVLEPGDHIKLGSLVLELRAARSVAPAVTIGRCLLVLSGPDRGRICALKGPRMALKTPDGVSAATLGDADSSFVIVDGVLGWTLEFVLQDDRIYFECAERPGLLRHFPGIVCDRLVGAHERTELFDGNVLVCGDVAFAVASTSRARALAEKLGNGEPTGDVLIDRVKPGAPPYWPGEDEFIIRVLSGPDRGSTLWLDPSHLVGPILIGRGGGAGLHLEVPERDCGDLSISFPSSVQGVEVPSGSQGGMRILNIDDRCNFNHNWEILRPGDEADLVSGDRITLGRTMLSFEHVPLQASIESFAIYHNEVEMPLVRAVNHIGYRPENELRIDDRRLGPRHGIVGVRHGGPFFYRHLNPETSVRIGDNEVSAGQECALEVGDVIVLTDGISVRFGERTTTHRPSDPILIGPTQNEVSKTV